MTEPMSETAWQKAITELLEQAGWEWNHCYRGKVGKGAWRTNTTKKGYPDLHIWGHGQSFYAELKTDTGSLSPEQEQVIASLRANGVEVVVWAPRQWPQIIDRLVKT